MAEVLRVKIKLAWEEERGRRKGRKKERKGRGEEDKEKRTKRHTTYNASEK